MGCINPNKYAVIIFSIRIQVNILIQYKDSTVQFNPINFGPIQFNWVWFDSVPFNPFTKWFNLKLTHFSSVYNKLKWIRLKSMQFKSLQYDSIQFILIQFSSTEFNISLVNLFQIVQNSV